MKFLNTIISQLISWAGTITLNNSSTGDIVDFKVSNVSKAKIDSNGNFTGTVTNMVNVTGDTMEGILVAQTNTSYTTAQVRNITLSTGDATGGNNGDIWIKYTA